MQLGSSVTDVLKNLTFPQRFPWKLHIMLDHMESDGDKAIACWQSHGRAFIVNKPKEFVLNVMPQFFNQSKYASFQRQLNLYGFSRLTHGRDKGAYFHACFVRGERDLCRKMIRQKIKGTKVRKTLSPEEEPNFYTMTGTLPNIPSEESLTEQPPQRCIKNRTSAESLIDDHNQVTPMPVKSIKRSVARRPFSNASETSSVVVQQTQQPPSATTSSASILNSIQPLPPATTRTVSPHQSSSTFVESRQKAYQSYGHRQLYRQQLPYVPQMARGGDLLFFEGQPFRYLEHLEPSRTSSNTSSPTSDPVQNSSVQDMVTTIVNLGTRSQSRPQTYHQQEQPQQLSCTNYNDGGAPCNICSV
jgi:hypothetical protein